jgi:uncharacterized protein
MQRTDGVAGEEIANGVVAATSVPSVGSVAVMPAAERSRYAPYVAATRWKAGPALGVTVLICMATLAIALGGGVLLLNTTQLGRVAAGRVDGLALVPMLLAQMTMIAGALMAARAKGDRIMPAMALVPPVGGLGAYAKWLFLQLAAVGAFTAVSAYVLNHDQTSDLKGMADIFRGPWWPLAIAVVGLGAPLSEELLFRGFLQPALVQTRLGFWGASAITTTLWTAMHAGYSLVGLTEVFLIGLLFCLMLRRTGSLRVTIAVHAIYNTLIALVVIFAPKSLLGF